MTARTLVRATAALTGAVLVVGLAHVPIQAAVPTARLSASVDRGNAFLGTAGPLSDLDTRGVTDPTSAQLSAAKGLSAAVRWNRYGTPASIAPLSGTLGPVTGDAAVAARGWLSSHAGLLGLTAAQVGNLELVTGRMPGVPELLVEVTELEHVHGLPGVHLHGEPDLVGQAHRIGGFGGEARRIDRVCAADLDGSG